MPVEVAVKGVLESPKECLITLVNPGGSDSVIKVFPSEHEEEKIWLDTARGGERWEAIQRLLDNFAEKGTRVPKPAKWHSDPKNLMSPDLKEKDIPLVKLDGAALKAPPPEDKLSFPQQNPPNVLELNKKVDDLTGIVSALATNVSHLSQAILNRVPVAREEVRPRAEIYSCSRCGKEFNSDKLRKMHVGRFHKE